ncbi:hypothetical protein Tco_0157180 [Tanacetum coccineum]
MLSKFIPSNTASSSNSGTLPSQTVTNPREHVNAITIRSGKTCEGPSTPLVPTHDNFYILQRTIQNLETSMDKVQKPSLESTAQVPPPEEEDSIFIEILKPKAKKTVNIEIQEPNSPKPTSYQPKLSYPERMKIGLKDALVEMPKFNKWLSGLLRNKEKLEEITITTVNAECSAIIMNKVPEKLEDPGKFLIPCTLQELDMTRKINIRVRSDELVFMVEKSEKSKNKQFAHAISVIDFSKDEPFSGSTTNHSDTLPPSSSPMKTSDNLEEFADELTPLKKDVHFQVYSNPLFEFDDNFTSSNVNPLFNEMDVDVENKNSNVSDSDEPVLLNTPLSNKDECFAPEDDIDEIDAFLAMEVSSNFEEGYFDSEGDVTFLDNLLSDDTTHNLASEVISDHDTSISFSPRSDPLHHEFAGELLTLPSRNDRSFEDYLNHMTLLCEISTSRDSVQEAIDIFLVPDDLILPGVENDDSKDEDIELPNNDHQDDPSIPRPPPKPPDVEKCFEPEAGLNQQFLKTLVFCVDLIPPRLSEVLRMMIPIDEKELKKNECLTLTIHYDSVHNSSSSTGTTGMLRKCLVVVLEPNAGDF